MVKLPVVLRPLLLRGNRLVGNQLVGNWSVGNWLVMSSQFQPWVLAAVTTRSWSCTRNGEASTRHSRALDPNWCLLSNQHLPVLFHFAGLRQEGDN